MTKMCKYGNHPIQEADRGFITFYARKGGELVEDSYACRKCDQNYRLGLYVTNGNIKTNTWMDCSLLHLRWEHGDEAKPDPAVLRLVGEMEPVMALAREWEKKVWFGGKEPHLDDTTTEPYDGLEDMGFRQYKEDDKGRRLPGMLPEGSLQAFVLPAEWKGYDAAVEGLNYTSYTMCGRSIFQIEDAKTHDMVSIILDDASPKPRGGIRSIDSTSAKALEMIQRATEDWEAGKISLVHNEDVGF